MRVTTDRDVTDQEYETALRQWTPQLVKVARSWIPNWEFEELMQEFRLVLLKCLRAYDEGRGAKFHTFLYRALQNRVGSLAKFEGERRGRSGRTVVYLSQVELEVDEGRLNGPGAAVQRALAVEDEPSLAAELACLGVGGLSAGWIEDAGNGLSYAQSASRARVSGDEMRTVARETRERLREVLR